MNPYAEAEQLFRKSEMFDQFSNPVTIGGPSEMRRFLENRLISTFQLGVATGEMIAEDRAKKRKAKR